MPDYEVDLLGIAVASEVVAAAAAESAMLKASGKLMQRKSSRFLESKNQLHSRTM